MIIQNRFNKFLNFANRRSRSASNGMKKIIALVSVFPLMLAALLSLGSTAFAQSEMSVRVQPAIVDENVEPGQVLHETVHVSNQDAQAKTFYFFAKDISNIEEAGQPVFVEGTDSVYGVSAWIKFDQVSLAVKGGGTKDFSFSVAVPKDASPCDHFGGVFLSLEAKRPTTTGTGIGLQIGTLVRLHVGGECVEDARIREFSTDKNIYSNPPVNFTTRVENLGNVLIKPHGPIEITNMFGKKVAVLSVNEVVAGIFPKSQRSFGASWTPDGIAFGRYEATEALAYGSGDGKTVFETISFWVLPLNIILPVFFGILAIILIFYFGIRAYVRKKIRELQRGSGSVNPSVAAMRTAPSRLLFITLGFIVFSLLLLIIIFLLFS